MADIPKGKNRQKLEKAQSVLQRNSHLLPAVFDAIGDNILVLDKDLTVLMANQSMQDRFGRPLEGEKCYRVIQNRSEPCDFCPAIRALQNKQLEKEEITRNLPGSPPGTLMVSAFPIMDDEGSPISVVECIRDITERKLWEKKITNQERLYRSLFQKNASAILLINPDTTDIVDANPAACSYYGYTREELKSMKISDINTSSKAKIRTGMEEAKAEKRNYFNFRHRMANGEIHDVEVFTGPILLGDKPLLCSIIHDISERKKLERQKEKLITRLKTALKEINALQGIIPICSQCKKIRDDKGYWNQLESYFEKHSQTSFSHGMCPECSDELYGDKEWYIDMKKKK